MSLESIQQSAKNLRDTYRIYESLLQQKDAKQREKILQTKKYMTSLVKNMQRMIEEEKNNVS